MEPACIGVLCFVLPTFDNFEIKVDVYINRQGGRGLGLLFKRKARVRDGIEDP
jgi:hypothetical protein